MKNKKVSEIDKTIAALVSDKQDIIKAADDKRKAELAEAARKSRAEIDDVVAMYNQQEGEQGQRLGRLFYLIKQRKGNRRVVFSNGDMWTDWNSPDRLDAGFHIQRLGRSIKEVIPGE